MQPQLGRRWYFQTEISNDNWNNNGGKIQTQQNQLNFDRWKSTWSFLLFKWQIIISRKSNRFSPMFSSRRDQLKFKIWTKILEKNIHFIIPELYWVAWICLPPSAHFLMYHQFLLVHYQCHGDHIQPTFILTDFISVTNKKKNLLKRILIITIFWLSLQGSIFLPLHPALC